MSYGEEPLGRPDLEGAALFGPPSFRDSFRSRLQEARLRRADAMERLVRLATEEMALERILDEPPAR